MSKLLKASFLSFVLFSSYPFLSLSQEKMLDSFVVYLTEKGQKYFSSDLQILLAKNGLNFDDYIVENKEDPNGYLEYPLGEKSLKEYISDKDMYELVSSIKGFVNSYLVLDGNEENAPEIFIGETHKFKIELKDIYLENKIEDFGITFLQDEEVNNTYSETTEIKAYLTLSVKSLLLEFRDIIFKDEKHPFLGEYGASLLRINFTENDGPLVLKLYFKMQMEENSIRMVFEDLKTNIEDVYLQFGFDVPLIFPDIVMGLKPNIMKVNKEKIEELVFRNKELISERLKSLFNELAPSVTSVLNEKVNFILDNLASNSDVNEMTPPAAPEGAVKYLWGLYFSKLKLENRSLKIVFDSFISDPLSRLLTPTNPNLFANSELYLPAHALEGHDLVVGINQGFFNRIFFHNFKRGYFSNMNFGTISVAMGQAPILNLKNCSSPSYGMPICSPYLQGTILYPAAGFQNWAFKTNPVSIDLRLDLGFFIEDGNVGLKVTEFYPQYASIDQKQIKFGFGWIVNSQTDSIFKNMQKKLKNFVLAQNLPIPNSMWGLDFKITDIGIDPSGYLLIYFDFIKEGDHE